ncbi:MAG: carboxy-S-adenosyl-L-methionine synthase CmoA [Xanthomonadales bacterium]|nr:carboxy-S-adenosyl-L-methionine synthase CmoA [Xanthomonadales bacterium]
MSKEYDKLFATNRARTTGFKFDDQVVRVFPDMITRSVPGYELVVPMIGLLARRYAQPGSNLYDLGCSLGATSLAMAGAVNAKDVQIIAVDNSTAMVSQFGKLLEELKGGIPIRIRHQDILETSIEDASVVVLNFTLQFIEREHRQHLLNTIAAGMKKDAALVVSEKILFADEQEQAYQTAWHHDFKRTQGYSELEIAQKRDALEDVLRPDTEEIHFRRFEQAGLSQPRRWFQCFSFASYIAFK